MRALARTSSVGKARPPLARPARLRRSRRPSPRHPAPRPPKPPPRFAAGFTSVMAGTMLATETVKLLLGQPLSPQHTRCQQRDLPVPEARSRNQRSSRPRPRPGLPRLPARQPGDSHGRERYDGLPERAPELTRAAPDTPAGLF